MECGCRFEDATYLASSCHGGASSIGVFMSLVDLLIRTSCHISQPCRRYPNKKSDEMHFFDFIVVGGGVAGSVVASRLSENKKWKVALLEAGSEEPAATGVPAFSTSAIGTDFDWKFKTEPEESACLSTGGVCKWPRGKMLGGTGSMTGMMYNRGHRDIYDSWAREGSVGWSYYECLQFFKKAEQNKNPDLIERPYHGTKGPLVVQQFEHAPPIAYDILKAGREIGLAVRDLNGANQTGIALAQVMVDGGVRASTPRMYLRPNVNRNNLYLKLNATVTRVVIDKFSMKALGVDYYQNGKKYTIYAKKEVILSAGAIGSPHLLLLSGVGPREQLEEHKIDVFQDLRVGENLHNHVGTSVYFTVKDQAYEPALTLNTLNEYIVNQTGPLSSTGLTQLTAFMHTKFSKHVPDVQMFFDGFSALCPDEEDRARSVYGNRVPIRARPTNIMTKSRGCLKLRSNNPFDPPMIYANYLTDKQDADVLVEAIKMTIELSQSEALRKWDMRLEETPMVNCSTHEFGSDEYWYCVVHMYTGPENHPAGSCKMGPRSDQGDVVDPELRVHGIPNLRVIDASIFPRNPNSNPIAAIVMVAEKGAHMIHQAWNYC